MQIASTDDGQAVAVKKDRILATSFHPELTSDTRLHALFLELAKEAREDPRRNRSTEESPSSV